MRHRLFRQEVIETRRGTWLGPIQAAAPLRRWILVLLALALACAILVFLIYGHYTRRTRVKGLLVPSAGLQMIDARITGSISRVWVREGQHVIVGQPLVTLSGDANSLTMGDIRASISRRLHSRQERYKSDRRALKVSTDERKHELYRQLALFKAQRGQIIGQLHLLHQRSDSDSELLRRIEPLGRKGYVSAIQIEQQRAQILQDQVQIRGLTRQKLELAQKISATKQDLAQIPIELTRKNNAIARNLDAIGQELAKNEAMRSVILRAQSAGMVSSLLAVKGQAIKTGEALLSIVPEGSRLQAQMLVPSRAVGFIKLDSDVVLRYRSYPYQKFGQQYGRISSISHSALGPSEVFALTSQRSVEPLYRVRVRLERQQIPSNGRFLPLKPGMAFDADILMDRRSLLEWLFEPLFGLHQRISGSGGTHG